MAEPGQKARRRLVEMRQELLGERHMAAPAMLPADPGELRVEAECVPSQPLLGGLDRPLTLRAAAADQQAAGAVEPEMDQQAPRVRGAGPARQDPRTHGRRHGLGGNLHRADRRLAVQPCPGAHRRCGEAQGAARRVEGAAAAIDHAVQIGGAAQPRGERSSWAGWIRPPRTVSQAMPCRSISANTRSEAPPASRSTRRPMPGP